VLLVPGQLAAVRTTSVALGPDGALYVAALKSPDLKRIVNPAGASPTLETVGRTSDGGGIAGLAFVGNDVYLAQDAAVTRIASALTCAGDCLAQPTAMQVVGPTGLAADAAAGVLYVADAPVDTAVVRRYRIGAGTQDVLVNTGDAGAPLLFTLGITVDSAGAVWVGDDASAGELPGQGRLWKVKPPVP
jgi:hypothetical protein